MANVRRVLASGITRFGLVPYSELDLTASILNGDLVDGTLTNAKFNASAALDVSKLDVGTDGQVLTTDTGVVTWADVSDLPPTPSTARPAGEVAWFAGATAPSGWLVADGTSYLRADYSDLFAYIGVLHGSADGTHFNVPNLVESHMRGASANGSDVGDTGGSDNVTLVSNNLPSHTHTFSATTGATSGGTPSGTNSGTTPTTPSGTVGTTDPTGDTITAKTSFLEPAAGSTTNYIVTSVGSNSHTHSFTGNSQGSHTHTFTGDLLATHTHSVSGTTGSTGSGTAVDVTPKHVKLLPCIKT